MPLRPIRLKNLADRESHALKTAIESISHINQNATPHAQSVFELLVKACAGNVRWGGEGGKDIVVFEEIIVAGPGYAVADCKMLNGKGKKGTATNSAAGAAAWGGKAGDGSEETAAAAASNKNWMEEDNLERVKKVVASGATAVNS
jgi:hypothetical protein